MSDLIGNFMPADHNFPEEVEIAAPTCLSCPLCEAVFGHYAYVTKDLWASVKTRDGRAELQRSVQGAYLRALSEHLQQHWDTECPGMAR